MTSRPFRMLLVADGLAYFCAASLTISTTRFSGGVAFIWIATALLIGRLSSTRRSQWAPILLSCGIASAAATTLFGFGGAAAPALAVINMGEAVVATLLLRRSRIPDTPFQSLDWMMNFIVATGVIAPLFTGFIAAGIAHLTTGSLWTESFMRWYAGHALGNLTFAPIATFILRGDIGKWLNAASRRLMGEAVLLLMLVAATTLAVFVQTSLPLTFVPVLPIILVTFRIGRLGAAASIVLLALIGGTCTLMRLGPLELMRTDTGTQLQFFQFYLAATVLTILPVAADLARRGQLYRALRDSEARYRVLAEHSTDIILNLDTDGRILFASPSIHQLGGYVPDELIGRDASLLIAPDYVETFRDTHRRTILARGEPISMEFLALARTGDARWFETHARAVVTDEGEIDGVVSIVRDIAARKALEVRLTADAATDPLTGLLNRRAFLSLLERNGAKHGCVALLDIDHFKTVNDRFGHAAGDLVLQNFAQVARRTLRGDDHLARIGGEEFALLLPGATLDQAEFVCNRLRQKAGEAAVMHEGSAIKITVSGGVAPIIGSQERVLKIADDALYQAKLSGRNRLSVAA